MKTLFTDLDGTFIPGDDISIKSLEEFSRIIRHDKNLKLVYVTGRNKKETMGAIKEYKLPIPDSFICDVGTTIYNKKLQLLLKDISYYRRLKKAVNGNGKNRIVNDFLKLNGLKLQERTKQREFKISFYYNTDNASFRDFDSIIRGTGWDKVISVDNNGTGLLDILPTSVNKLYAINWYIGKNKLNKSNCAFAGDSGNDLEVFKSDIHSIVVNNCSNHIKNEVKNRGNIYCSKTSFTQGVLEGCNYFKII